jgi:hypothetical protein
MSHKEGILWVRKAAERRLYSVIDSYVVTVTQQEANRIQEERVTGEGNMPKGRLRDQARKHRLFALTTSWCRFRVVLDKQSRVKAARRCRCRKTLFVISLSFFYFWGVEERGLTPFLEKIKFILRTLEVYRMIYKSRNPFLIHVQFFKK